MLREEAVDEEEREEECARQGRRPAPAAAPESQILAAAAAMAVGRAGGRGMFSCGVCAARGRGVRIEQVQGSADDDEAGRRGGARLLLPGDKHTRMQILLPTRSLQGWNHASSNAHAPTAQTFETPPRGKGLV
jgi:hypothetical protein